jgi:hypothetical protein
MVSPSAIYPEAARFLNIARETAGAGTLATTGFASIPVASFDPDPVLNPIPDNALRGSMAEPYDYQMGASWTEASIPESPLYGDTIGYVLSNIFGDWTDTGTSLTVTTTVNHAGGYPAGTTGAITVSSGTSFSAGAPGFVQIDTGSLAEVVAYSVAGATSITLSGALRFAHATGVTVLEVGPPFTHVFSTLNPASATGIVSGQPCTHTIQDRNQVAGSAGFYADQFAYCCFSEIALTGKPLGYLSWSGKLMAEPQVAATTAPVAAWSGVRGIPAWRGTSTVAGTPVSDVASWTVTLSRKVDAIPTIDGLQGVYVFSRGPLTGTFDISYSPALDETALNYLLNNTQPSLQWSTSNGLSGAALVSFTINALYGAVTKSPLKVTSSLFGYDLSGTLVANQTNTGNSGGWSVAQCTLVNAVGSY